MSKCGTAAPPVPPGDGVVLRKRVFPEPSDLRASAVELDFDDLGSVASATSAAGLQRPGSRQVAWGAPGGLEEMQETQAEGGPPEPVEATGDKVLRLVVKVQSTVRGIMARAKVRKLMMVAVAKEEEPEMEWGTGDSAPSSGMAAAKLKSKAKQAEKKRKKFEQAELAKVRAKRAAERQLRTTIARKFKAVDTDCSGALDSDEMKVFLQTLSVDMELNLSKGQIKKAIKKMDGDESGEISFDEFAAWWAQFNDPEQKASFFKSLFSGEDNDQAEYEAQVKAANKEIKKRARKKRKGKSLEEGDGLWPSWTTYLVHASCWFFCLACGWYTIMTALAFGPELTIAWLGGCIVTTVYEAVVQDPMKIGIFVFFSEGAEVWLDLYYDALDWMPCCAE